MRPRSTSIARRRGCPSGYLTAAAAHRASSRSASLSARSPGAAPALVCSSAPMDDTRGLGLGGRTDGAPIEEPRTCGRGPRDSSGAGLGAVLSALVWARRLADTGGHLRDWGDCLPSRVLFETRRPSAGRRRAAAALGETRTDEGGPATGGNDGTREAPSSSRGGGPSTSCPTCRPF